MAGLKKRTNFIETEEGIQVRTALERMMGDAAYNTTASFSPNTTDYPDNRIPFADKHMNYLTAHPNLDANMYVSNLRMMTRVR